MVVLRVEVKGRRDGRERQVIYDAVDRSDPDTGVSAMERTTGFSLAITGLMQARGQVAEVGAATPDLVIPAAEYLAELGRRGIEVRRREA
jgi:lysine 6-dehydrogenase